MIHKNWSSLNLIRVTRSTYLVEIALVEQVLINVFLEVATGENYLLTLQVHISASDFLM